MKYYILVFESTHKALTAEKTLLAAGIKFDIIPTPKNISSDCGISIRLLPDAEILKKTEETLAGKNTGYKVYKNG